MATQTIVLYGNRRYDKETYSTNQDPQSFIASLSDSVSMTDSEKQAAIKALAEAITLAETWKTSGNKVLSDSSTMTETLAKALIMHALTDTVSMSDAEHQAAVKAISDALTVADTIITRSATKALTESLTMTEQRLMSAITFLVDSLIVADSKISLQQIKGLTDFILVKDWVELKWKKADVWTATPAFNFRPSKIHNYGPGVYYGVDFYSSNPTVNWLLTAMNPATWKTTPTVLSQIQLYEKTSYGSKPYGSTPQVQWSKPTNTGKEAWTNNDGESHN